MREGVSWIVKGLDERVILDKKLVKSPWNSTEIEGQTVFGFTVYNAIHVIAL